MSDLELERTKTKSSARATVARLAEVYARIQRCEPPRWARGGHAQTILGHLLRSPQIDESPEVLNVSLEREDERIVSSYLRGESEVAVYLFHGLGGHTEAGYMQRTARIARAMGHHVFLNNHRGCGAGVGLAVEPYHSGRAEDLGAVMEFGRRMLPDHRHVAIGFSLSANALLLLAAGVRSKSKPDAAIAVNGPIELDSASRKLNEGLNLLYNLRFVLELKQSIKDRQRTGRLRESYPLDRVLTVRQFDHAYTAPAGGFASRDEYHRLCSARQYLPQIDIPTVLLTAGDDPFVDSRHYESAILSESTVLHLEPHGGHMGYLCAEPTPLGTRRWLDYALHNYLNVLS